MHLLLLFVSIFAATLASPLTTSELSRQEANPSTTSSELDPLKPCSCTGPECQCCVDFNMTFVDLGGPGCILLKYISKEEGILVNVSYGDSQLHGEQIKGQNPSLSCMNILLDLAQMCARISNVEVTDDGMKACAGLEPTLLGDAQDSYHLGCFLMGPQGMKLINSTNPALEGLEDASKPVDIKPEVSEESLIDAVNESAEEGIAWFSSFLGLNFGKVPINETKPSLPPTETTTNQKTQRKIKL